MDFARRILRNIGYSVWALLSVLFAVLAGAGFTGAVEDSSSGSLIALGGLAFAVAVTTLYVAVQRLRGKPVRGGMKTGLALTMTALLLILVLAVASLLSGPL